MARPESNREGFAGEATLTRIKLRTAEDRYRALVEALTSLVWTADATGAFVTRQPSWEAFTGQPWAEHQGWGWAEKVHPDDRAQLLVRWQSAVVAEAPYRDEARIWSAQQGDYRYFELRAVPLRDGDGSVIEWVGTLTDVDDKRRAAEELGRRAEQLRSLADLAAHVSSITSIDTMLETLTERARQLIGAHEAMTWLAPGEGAEGPLKAIAESGRRRRKHHDTAVFGPHVVVCNTNRPVRLSRADFDDRGWLAAPLVRRDGRNCGLIQLTDKIDGEFTEADEAILVQLAHLASVAIETTLMIAELDLQKRRAEEANRTKDEFLAMLGHELRNPLAPIMTALQLMRLRGDEHHAEERKVIERQVQHVVRLVDDLLDVSRVTRGRLELRRKPVDLASVIAKAVEIVSPLLERQMHRLQQRVQNGLVVDGDVARLTQVVSNVLTNAAKYTEPRGVISIEAEQEGREAVIRIRDNGIGMSPELLSRVFEPFMQAEQGIDRSQGGLGLGLSIVRSLVDLHGGSVSARSDGPGRGSEFEIRLPRAPGERSADASSSMPPLQPPRDAGAASLRILIVDDNVDAAATLAEALEVLGHETQVAHDGPRALATADATAPHVVILDIGLPVMDGYEVARRLRIAAPRTVLIAATGYGQDADRERCRSVGFAAHFVKPVRIEALVECLDRVSRTLEPRAGTGVP